jgi:ABC-2 type transport system permease protein
VIEMQRLGALVSLRSRMWWHGLRSRATAADTAVAVILVVIAAVLSGALAFALSVITHVGLRDGDEAAVHVGLLVVFWMLGFLAVVMPLFFGFGQPQVPLRRLLVFPFSHWNLYRISLASSFVSGVNLFWYPVLAAVSIVACVVNVAPPAYWLVATTVFAVCLVVWCNTLMIVLQWVLRKRSVRELATLVGLILVVVVSMLPAMYQEEAEERGQDWLGDLIPKPVTSAVVRIAAVFPPSIVVRGLGPVILGETGTGVGALVWLALWTAAGVVIGFGIVRRNLLEGDRSIHVQSRIEAPTAGGAPVWMIERLAIVPKEVFAVAAKELRYLLRSTTGKFNIVVMPVFVIIMALIVFRDLEHAFLGLERISLVFVGLMIYASMFSNNFLFNAWAWEGTGVQSFFLSPVEPKRIVLGKNLGVWIYNIILGVEGVIFFIVVSGMPPASALLGGCLAFVASLLLATIVGNFLSPVMPVPRDISSVTNSPSQTAVLATFGVLIGNSLLIGGCMAIPALLGVKWLGPLLLTTLIAVESVLYAVMLRSAGQLLDSRRESLIEALQA